MGRLTKVIYTSLWFVNREENSCFIEVKLGGPLVAILDYEELG